MLYKDCLGSRWGYSRHLRWQVHGIRACCRWIHSNMHDHFDDLCKCKGKCTVHAVHAHRHALISRSTTGNTSKTSIVYWFIPQAVPSWNWRQSRRDCWTHRRVRNMIVIQYNMVVARAEAGRIDQEFPKTNQIWLGDVPNNIFFQPGTGEVLRSQAY